METPYICDSCDGAAEGDRFHCQVCEDFDLCSSCFGKIGASHGHKFDKVSVVDEIINTFHSGGVKAFFREDVMKEEQEVVEKVEKEAEKVQEEVQGFLVMPELQEEQEKKIETPLEKQLR